MLAERELGLVWVDSMYLELVPGLREQLSERARLGLLLHYLPTLVTRGAPVTAAQLSRVEREALEHAELALVTSPFMQNVLASLGFAGSLGCVEPGCELEPSGTLPAASSGVRALLLSHVVSGKGIEPLLAALARMLAPTDPFSLRVVGDVEAEPAYALRCQALVAQNPELRARVTFAYALADAGVQAELCKSNLLLSASVMESYGMALAEGRRVGLPLLARAGGNVSAHVRAEAGGELVADAEALARACVRLCRDPAEHSRRLTAARNHIPARRSWRDAARELASALQMPGFFPGSSGALRERA